MAAVERIESLRAKHAALEHKLEEVLHHPYPDDTEVARIKREKLFVKDEMARLVHA
jgi:hypothetical protein